MAVMPKTTADIAELEIQAREDGSMADPPTCFVAWAICYQLARIADALEIEVEEKKDRGYGRGSSLRPHP